ncbi:PorV/PorQ family protein [bacterium]|nr:PorV/PorQ family protein [bacterium]
MQSFKTILKIFFLCLLSVEGQAGGFTTAKYAGEFLGLGVGGRSLGMGGAYVAVARDVTSGYWNPAGLAFIEYPQIMLMHSSQFEGIMNYDYGSFAMPVSPKSTLGISVFRIGVGNIPRTALINPEFELGETFVDENGQLVRNTAIVEGFFGSTDYALFLSYSKKVSEVFSYGGNVKLLNKSIDENSAWGIGFDLGFVFHPVERLIIGVTLRDVTSTMLAWDTGRRELITPSLITGFSYPIAISFASGTIQPALDLITRFENRNESAQASIGPSSFDVNLGWEYEYGDAFAVRLGSSEVGEFAAGVGLHLPKLQLDYAFIGHQDLGPTHRISARLTLKEPRFRRKK